MCWGNVFLIYKVVWITYPVRSAIDVIYIFDQFPCTIKGQVKQEEKLFSYAINAGGWMTITVKNESYLYANYNEENIDLFLAGPKKPEN